MKKSEGVLRGAVVLILAGLVLPAFAQTPEPPEMPGPVPGSAISIPVPDNLDPRDYEIPELSGAEVARGSFLLDGRLPRPIVDYVATISGVRQRISIFENGIVAVSMTGAGFTLRKRLLIPLDALERYRAAITTEALEDTDELPHRSGPTADHALLRVYRDDGTSVERNFNPAVVQGFSISKPLAVVNDLLRALAEDREVTNPLTGYTPRIGDHLIADDEQTYRVVAVIDSGRYVELASTREPLTIYVATKDLQKHFIGRRRSPQPRSQ